MKTTKRIFAMVMTLMLIVAMVPFAVSAATPDASFKVKCDASGFKFTIYQVATVDTETGLYTAVATDSGIKNSIENKDGAQDLFDACEAASSGYGTEVTTYSSGSEATISGKAGIFYIKCIEKPATVKSVSNSLVVAPQYKNGAWVDLTETVDISSKVKTDEPKVSKEIVAPQGDYYTKTRTTAAVGDTITFKLTATVVGSKEEKLTAYSIKDTHDKALKFKEIKSVVVTGGDGEDITLAEGTDYERTNASETGFDVELKTSDKALGNDAFYSKSDVVVTYTAELTSDAKIGNPGNKNHDALAWKNSVGTDGSKDGNDVFVYTFKIQINKVDSDTNKPLDGVKFAVYSTKADAEAGSNALKDNLVTADGKAEVTGVDAGTYYVKETATIDNYNLNTKVYEIKIEPTFSGDSLETVVDGLASVTVPNTKTRIPKTGVEGTMVFTFVGAGLVLLAGALFVVAMKKKSVK